jgi:hypothetical protein
MEEKFRLQKLTPENVEVARQQGPLQLRPQAEKERAPDTFQKSQERSGNSSWSGASGGGGVWAGRREHER